MLSSSTVDHQSASNGERHYQPVQQQSQHISSNHQPLHPYKSHYVPPPPPPHRLPAAPHTATTAAARSALPAVTSSTLQTHLQPPVRAAVPAPAQTQTQNISNGPPPADHRSANHRTQQQQQYQVAAQQLIGSLPHPSPLPPPPPSHYSSSSAVASQSLPRPLHPTDTAVTSSTLQTLLRPQVHMQTQQPAQTQNIINGTSPVETNSQTRQRAPQQPHDQAAQQHFTDHPSRSVPPPSSPPSPPHHSSSSAVVSQSLPRPSDHPAAISTDRRAQLIHKARTLKRAKQQQQQQQQQQVTDGNSNSNNNDTHSNTNSTSGADQLALVNHDLSSLLVSDHSSSVNRLLILREALFNRMNEAEDNYQRMSLRLHQLVQLINQSDVVSAATSVSSVSMTDDAYRQENSLLRHRHSVLEQRISAIQAELSVLSAAMITKTQTIIQLREEIQLLKEDKQQIVTHYQQMQQQQIQEREELLTSLRSMLEESVTENQWLHGILTETQRDQLTAYEQQRQQQRGTTTTSTPTAAPPPLTTAIDSSEDILY